MLIIKNIRNTGKYKEETHYPKFYYLKVTDDNIWLTSFQTALYAYIERRIQITTKIEI